MVLRSTLTAIAIGGCVGLAMMGNAAAQPTPDTDNGRYTFAPTADGVLRLDTRSGSIASCHNRIAGWSCYAVPDERAALDTEIGRLQRENTALKDNLERFKGEQERLDREISTLKQAHARLDAERMKLKEDLDRRALAEPGGKIDAPLPKTDSLKQGEAKQADKGNRIELPLPDEREIQRVVSFLERAWRQLVEMANRVQRDVSGKI